jgi:hypothetical protein
MFIAAVGGITLFFKIEPQQLANIGVVVNNKNLNRHFSRPFVNFKNFKFFGGKKNAQISEFGTCIGTLFVHGSLRQED